MDTKILNQIYSIAESKMINALTTCLIITKWNIFRQKIKGNQGTMKWVCITQ